MIALRVTVPIACFRKGLAREYLETEPLPPPATCYGFLLSLVGETDRTRHLGVSLCPMIVGEPDLSVVLRTIWRVKKTPLGSPGNTRPDYQQLLSLVELILFVDSHQESKPATLEERVTQALRQPASIDRFGGLSFGESTHMVNDVTLLAGKQADRFAGLQGEAFLVREGGRLTLPIWVDHIGSAGTLYASGDLVPFVFQPGESPRSDELATIRNTP